MSVWKWSQTATENDDADSTINLREGWAPSIVNNAVRSVLAAIAKWRDDISGNLVTGGSLTAYTLTTNQNLTTLTDGFSVKARMHTTSGASPTLKVDSVDAKNIRSLYGTNIPDGALVEGGVYSFTYNSADAGWIVQGAPIDADLAAIAALAGTNGVARKTAANTWALDEGVTNLIIIKDGGGGALEAGVIGDLHVPFACTITGVTLLADQAGDAVVDIWKDALANFPPTNTDSITASAEPTLSNAASAQDTTLSGWTTSISAGDVLRFNLDSVSSITRLEVVLTVKRFI